MSPDGVVIVLSSYNGATFITEQIESIRRQTFTGWQLLVRDDGSTDETVPIVERHAEVDPRIVLVRDRRGNLGPARSFGVLLEQASNAGARYLALADQDDVWRPDKLERELALLRRREEELGETIPLLVHSDLTVVDQRLNIIAPSYLAFERQRPVSEGALSKLLIQNFVTGCTTLVNRSLLRASLPFPEVVMHDWWLALCAAAMGEVLHLPEATVLYRQHGLNALGSQGWREIRRETLRRPFAWWRRSSTLFAQVVHQGCELARRVERQSRDTAVSYPSLVPLREFRAAFGGTAGPLSRLRAVRRHGIKPRSLLPYPVCFYARVLLGTRSSVGGGPDFGNPTSPGARAAPWRRGELPTFSSKD